MNLKEISRINRHPGFIQSRLKYRKTSLTLMSFTGILLIISWPIIYKWSYSRETGNEYLWLNIITISLFLLNLLIFKWRKNIQSVNQHLYAGFYIATVYCILLTVLYGSGQNNYWYSLLIVLIVWFILMPFGYRDMMLHCAVFISSYLLIFILGELNQTGNFDLITFVGIYSGVYLLGVFTTICRNHIDVVNFSVQLAIEESNKELKKYKLVLDQAPGAVFIMDKNSNFEYINPYFTQLSGYTKKELLHNSIVDTLYKGKIPDSRYDLTETIKNGKTWQGELLTYTKKGSPYWVNTIAAPYTDEQGNVDGFIVIQMDITDRTKMEKALRESEAKYRELVETTNSIILKWDDNFNIIFLNEFGLKFFGFTRDEIIGKPVIGTIVASEEKPSGRNLIELMGDIFKHPENYSQNINENIRKNGERVWVSWNNTAIRNENGKVTAMFSVGADITERKKYEEELRVTKEKLQELNQNLEKQVNETANRLTEAKTQLIQLQKENLQSQFEVLRQQVNPHFLFNSLNVLTSLIKLEPDLAEKFTEHLSKVYRYVLENKDNDLVSLSTELDFLDAYLFLLNIRFMNKLVVDIHIEGDKKDYLILPLALQLLIENAIKHNTMSKKSPLEIKIFIDDEQKLNIVNNLQERESQLASTGVGLKNILHRYRLLELPEPEFIKSENLFTAKIPLKLSINEKD